MIKTFQENILEINISNVPEVPGIYVIKNKLNNKYYVGQSINLKERLQRHRSKIRHNSKENLIYKSIFKNGYNNFEYSIIEIIEEKENLKEILDNKEIYYINYYNSYYKGYNQTKGGDKSLTGYKYTEEQKLKRSQISKQICSDGRFQIYIYDYYENKIYSFSNSVIAAKELNLTSGGVIKYKNNKKVYRKRYIIDSNKESLLERSKKLISPLKNKIDLSEYSIFRKSHLNLSIKEVSKILNISETTVSSYDFKLNIIHGKSSYIWKILNIETNEILELNPYEGAEMFHLSPHSFNAAGNRSIKNNTLYKKKFKFIEKWKKN